MTYQETIVAFVTALDASYGFASPATRREQLETESRLRRHAELRARCPALGTFGFRKVEGT